MVPSFGRPHEQLELPPAVGSTLRPPSAPIAPQELLPRVAGPNAAGGAALAGPGGPPTRVSLYPLQRLVTEGDPAKVPAGIEKKL